MTPLVYQAPPDAGAGENEPVVNFVFDSAANLYQIGS
jgi:hypothetical protein